MAAVFCDLRRPHVASLGVTVVRWALCSVALSASAPATPVRLYLHPAHSWILDNIEKLSCSGRPSQLITSQHGLVASPFNGARLVFGIVSWRLCLCCLVRDGSDHSPPRRIYPFLSNLGRLIVGVVKSPPDTHTHQT